MVVPYIRHHYLGELKFYSGSAIKMNSVNGLEIFLVNFQAISEANNNYDEYNKLTKLSVTQICFTCLLNFT